MVNGVAVVVECTYAKIRCLGFDFTDVDRFVDFLFCLGRLFDRADDLKDFQRRQIGVDTSHESFEKDHLGQANAQALEIAGKLVQLVEIVQLHGGREVEREMLQIGTVSGEHA